MSADKKFMEMALALAAKGIGEVEPNPMVGCVIVKDGEIIGRGYHEKFGSAHAEINALANCEKNGFSPASATMYVTLEPCCHFGKTPPCSDAIINAKIARVAAAMQDPTEKVSGKGLERLASAGIEVDVGLCQKEAESLNPAFVKFAKTNLPWVVVKWAQSADGFLSRTDDRRWISNEQSRGDSQKLRRRSQAILVGINTVIEDDPLLTVRPYEGRGLLRVVLDGGLRISLDSRLLTTTEQSPVLIITTSEALKESSQKADAVKKCGADILAVEKVNGRCDLPPVSTELGKRQVQQLLVEGGVRTISSFLSLKIADEAAVYITQERLGRNGKTKISESMADLVNFLNSTGSKEQFGGDMRLTGLIG